jgi:hypothetical protein
MSSIAGIPKGAIIAINDMLDSCARVQPGQEVLILAQIDGLYGGDNLVDQETISWIQTSVHERGANASVLWIDEVAKPHAWRFPPVVKAALEACDLLISHSFDLVIEEIREFRKYLWERGKKIRMVRNFATTVPLLCTNWAQTPYELLCEIRHQAAIPYKGGLSWQLYDDNGTHLEGTIVGAPYIPDSRWSMEYDTEREIQGPYFPWPEWVHQPITISDTYGIFVFDSMLSWWSRYIGISPYFRKPIQLTIDNCRITQISGGDEADALKRFLYSMREHLGEGVYNFNALHTGVHPQASVSLHQCPNILHRRLIEHAHTSNIHFHIGAPLPPWLPNPPGSQSYAAYPYWMHCTGDIRTATFRVGKTLMHDRGHLTALDHPAVRAVASKYPGRPGLEPVVRSYSCSQE